jgi:hypothetical protein
LPFYVRRIIGRYQPYLRDAIADAVRKKSDEVKRSQGREITAEEISECVGEVISGPGDRNLRMEHLSLHAVEHGQYKPLREVIDELRASIAESRST